LTEERGKRSVKRISRAGSGGFSIYLPKRWMSDWTEEQMSKREVEMFEMGEKLILSPMMSRMGYDVRLEGRSQEELIYHVLSAYINGVDDFSMSHEGLTEIDAIEIRNIVRFLDENLSVRVEGDKVEYKNRPVAVHDVNNLLELLFDKLIEAENLAAELLNDCDTDREHSIHLMRMLYSIEKEDLNRLTLQIFRDLSKFRTPLRSLVDANFMWSAANMLEIIGDALFGLVSVICSIYGLKPDDLQYPSEYLEGRLKERGGVLRGAEKLRMQLVIDLREAAMMLTKAKEAISSGDGEGAFAYKDEIRDQVRAMESELASGMGDFCNSCEGDRDFLPIMLMAIRVREVMYLTKSLTKRAALIYYID
jgi:hypothetical protein